MIFLEKKQKYNLGLLRLSPKNKSYCEAPMLIVLTVHQEPKFFHEHNYIKVGKASENHTKKTHHCSFGLVVI
jgi:hypothetical protein